MNLYDEFYPVVVELLTEFGADATLVRTGRMAPTSAEQRAGRVAGSPGSPRSTATKAVVGPVKTQGADGRQIVQTVATMLAEPKRGDTLKMGTMSWVLGSVTRVAPQGKAIVYMAEVSS